VKRPENPIDYLIEKLKNPKPLVRLFVVGPPGSNRKEIALSLSDHFGWPCESIGDLLNKEVHKKTEMGKEIQECKKMYKYVPDDIVIELVKNSIAEYEKSQTNWVIEGFPRTMAQTVAMQKMGIYPTRIALLNVKKPSSQLKVKNNLISNATGLYGPELERVANNAIEEYYHHIKGVKELMDEAKLIQEYDANQSRDDVITEISKMIQIRVDNPFRLPRIIIMGPPGSGKTYQGEIIARRYGLTFISMKELLDYEVGLKSKNSQQILDCIFSGKNVPDDIILEIMKKRLAKTDCKLNGWVLDGFPMTSAQINLLKAANAKPSMVVMLECENDKCLGRIKERRYDPHTGRIINRTMDQDIDEDMYDRIIKLEEDTEDAINARIKYWEEYIGTAESAYNQCLLTVNTGELSAEDATNNICEAIINPMF
jgi:adenylate kinase